LFNFPVDLRPHGNLLGRPDLAGGIHGKVDVGLNDFGRRRARRGPHRHPGFRQIIPQKVGRDPQTQDDDNRDRFFHYIPDYQLNQAIHLARRAQT
jgi:hypothetical protein